jgi:hypothetical protein
VRAFGVMLGGSIALAAAAAASTVAVARAVLSRRRPSPLALFGTAATALYVLVIRPWHLRWGAQPSDERRPLPGDELFPKDGTQILHAVTIDAPVAQVWPWLAQVGQDRGGFYSYEWLENLAGCQMENADRIHPEWQHRELGETVHLHPAGGLRVRVFESGRALGLKGWGTFALEPLGTDRTRLIARGGVPPGAAAMAYGLLMEIPHFLMERRMLLGIKQRAEATRARTAVTPAPPADADRYTPVRSRSLSPFGGAGHRGFAIVNRTINPLVGWLICSPLHWLASQRLALITYTGRRSGRRYTIPVGYQMNGAQMTITVGSPDRKVWWRSLTGAGAPVELIVRGRRRTGHAVAIRAGDQALVRVAVDR